MRAQLVKLGIAVAGATVAAIVAACREETVPFTAEVRTDGPFPPTDRLDGGDISQPIDTYHDAGMTRDAGGTTDAGGLPDASDGSDAGPTPSPDLRFDVNISPGSFLAYFATDWSNGFFGKFDFQNRQASLPAATTVPSTDMVLRSHEGRLYQLDRINGTLSFGDKSFAVLGNAQDIVVLPGEQKAYISRLDSQNDPDNQDDLWVIDLIDGHRMKSFDLKPYTFTDEDRLARAAQMALVDNRYLLVLLQDLNTDFSANAPGKIVVIDTERDEILHTILLNGRNPMDITYAPSPDLQAVYVTCQGGAYPADLTTPYGGIERFSYLGGGEFSEPEMVIDDQTLEGSPREIRIQSTYDGFVAVDTPTFTTNLRRFNPLITEEQGALIYQGETFIGDFTLALGFNNALVAVAGAGLVVLDGDTQESIALPNPPLSIVFTEE